jgi:hypothetical protein
MDELVNSIYRSTAGGVQRVFSLTDLAWKNHLAAWNSSSIPRPLEVAIVDSDTF